jgi:hypothetical protein
VAIRLGWKPFSKTVVTVDHMCSRLESGLVAERAEFNEGIAWHLEPVHFVCAMSLIESNK